MMRINRKIFSQSSYFKGWINSCINYFLSTKLIFRRLYWRRKRQQLETVSGPGSTVEQTKETIHIVSIILKAYKIETILDIPCGDFNWMKHVDMGHSFYLGADIVDELILINRKCYGGVKRKFQVMDLLKDPIPEVDLVLCRDCLVHFSFKQIRKAIDNIKRSKSTYLLTTTFSVEKNLDIVTGDWRMLNLELPPFSFPKPLVLFCEGGSEESLGKSLGLWRIDQIA